MSAHPRLSAAIRPAHAALDGHALSTRIMAGRVSPHLWASIRSAWAEVLEPLDAIGALGPVARSPALLAEFAHVDRPRPVFAASYYARTIRAGLPVPHAHLWVAYAGLLFGGAVQRERVPAPHGLFDFGAARPAAIGRVRVLGSHGEDSEPFHAAAIAAFGAWAMIFDELEALS